MTHRFTSLYNLLLRKYRIDVPSKYHAALQKERINANLKRERILSVLLIVISADLLFGDIAHYTSEWVDKANIILHVMLIIWPSLFLISVSLKDKLSFITDSFVKVLHIALSTGVLAMCAFIVAINDSSWQQPFSYVVSLFSIASMVLFSQRESLLIYLSSYFIYTAGTLIFHSNNGGVPSSIAFMLFLVIVAYLLSRSSYSGFVMNYVNHRIISDKNRELDKLNKMTEDALEKRTEELNRTVEYEKLRTNFFANISHELRTPLTLIFSAQQMINMNLKKRKAEENAGNIKRYLVVIRQNSYRLLRLISNLIDSTKLNTGYIRPNLGNSDIVRVIRDISLSIRKFTEGMGLSLNFKAQIDEAVIAVDVEMIERIMLNLLSNAIKFTPKGGCISVGISEARNTVNISVKDTGIGIPEHMRALVFERLVQADPTNTRNREGSGIGLSLVKSLVDLHNGKIILNSQEGVGTEIIVSLPKKVLPPDAVVHFNTFKDEKHSLEKINIEFSDIYS